MPILNSWIIWWWWNEEMWYFATQWPCEYGFHVPTKDEWVAVYNAWVSLWAWTSSWRTNFRNYLKLPFAGYRYPSNSNVSYQGSYGNYWSSTRRNENCAYSLDYDDEDDINPQSYYHRSYAFSVRPFKNVPVTPTPSWTKLYWTSIEAGWIFWSSTYWLISLSSDWNTRITIADKNLWATTVYNSWDTLSEANCGKYYQWWNNYWFPRTWSVTTSSIQVNASTYWPWNYYSSSTFITRSSSPYRWDTTDNANLWGGVDGNVPFILQLKTYEEIVAMATCKDVVNELNLYPTEYLSKLTNEWHICRDMWEVWYINIITSDGTRLWANERKEVVSGSKTYNVWYSEWYNDWEYWTPSSVPVIG